jgi:NAD(P) transhydrogenase subunit alpha
VGWLVKMGMEVAVEHGAGEGAGHGDEEYTAAGALLAEDHGAAMEQADAVVRVRKPSVEEIGRMKAGCIHISFLDPFRETALVDALAAQHVSAVSVDLIPRSMAAQKMDALSGQANLSGYVAVILAAERLNKIFPMLITPAGTIPGARVLVIGAGIAGLQAIATAKRLGARVEAYDTREVVGPQVESLGAKFIEIDLGESSARDTYDKGLSPEQMDKQRQALAGVCARDDVVITAALVFGKEAPRVITRAMIAGMRPGSVVVDLAIESGGNVEGAELDKEVLLDGVRVIGLGSLPAKVSAQASQMYSSNLFNFLHTFWNPEHKTLELDAENEIIKSCLVTHDGRIVNEDVKQKRP